MLADGSCKEPDGGEERTGWLNLSFLRAEQCAFACQQKARVEYA